MRALGLALVLAAAIATPAAAITRYVYEGVAAPGETIEFNFEALKHRPPIVGTFDVTGGTIESAFLESHSTWVYVVEKPRQYIPVNFAVTCEKPTDAACTQLTNFGDTGFDFAAKGLVRQGPPPPGPGQYQYYLGDRRAYTTLSVTFDSAGPSSYLLKAQAGIPEPGAWALMIGGFGLAGASLRRRRLATA